MSHGILIKNEYGKAFISPDTTPLNFIKKITLSVPTNGSDSRNGNIAVKTDIPDEYILLPFLRIVSISHISSVVRINKKYSSNSMHVINLEHDGRGCTVELYLFANYVPVHSQYGIAIYNELGIETYNNLCRPLEINFLPPPQNLSGLGNDGTSHLNHYVVNDVGFPAAVLGTGYGLKSYQAGANNPGRITFTIFSTALGNSIGLSKIWYMSDGRFNFYYPNIGFITYIDTRKYQ